MFQNKKLGQVFLSDPNIIRKLIDQLPEHTDTIVEVGCGKGILTKELAKKTGHLHVIELDPKFHDYVKTLLSDISNVSFVLGDILKTKFSEVPSPHFSIVANIPYHISTKIIKVIIDDKSRVDRATLMVQKEFADKLTAKPGDKHYTSLSVYTQFHFEVTRLFNISKNSFTPVPKVDSSIISLTPKFDPFKYPDALFAVINAGFWGRRKTLIKCLKSSPYTHYDSQIESLPFFKEQPKVRAESLSLEKFKDLTTQLEESNRGV